MAGKDWNAYNSDLTHPSQAAAVQSALQDLLGQNYLQPSPSEVQRAGWRIQDFLGGRQLVMVVPMKEEGPVIDPLLSTVAAQMPPQSIVVVNDRSDPVAVRTALQYAPHVIVVDRDQVLEMVDWHKLLPVLSLSERPFGKGTAVLAGYLLQYFLAQELGAPRWMYQHDAEVNTAALQKGMEYTVWGILNAPHGTLHVKPAKAGRGNESVMAARSLLPILRHLLPLVSVQESAVGQVVERAQQLFKRLVPYKWMLSGEFALDWEVALRRPFTTGYSEETLTCTFTEDWSAEQGGMTVQVANPNPCFDGLNGHRKEAIIVQTAANFVWLLAMMRKPVPHWTMTDIAEFNHSLLSRPSPMGMIPHEGDEGPVQAELVPSERIVPSVEMLLKAGWVDVNAGRGLVHKILD